MDETPRKGSLGKTNTGREDTMKATIRHEGVGAFEITLEDGRTLWIDSDWDYPGIASSFLGRVPCECGMTDGTIDCKHYTASSMIQAAFEALYDADGDEIEIGDHCLDYFLEI